MIAPAPLSSEPATSLAIDIEHRVGHFTLAAKVSTGPGVTALFGRSGSGKTTLVNLIAGLIRPQRGRIVLGGRVVFDSAAGIDLPPRRRQIGYVFQDARLFPHLSVRHNLLYGRWFTPANRRYAHVDAVVELLGLGALLERRPLHLSGGEKQRVAIGRALLASPRIVLMDEPLAALDSARKAEILPYIERLRDELALPIIYVSHAIDEVARLADWLVLLDAGRIAAAGRVDEMMSRIDLRPLTGRYEAGALIETRVGETDGRYDLTTLTFAGGTLRVPRLTQPQGSLVRVRIRARDMAIALTLPQDISIQNAVAARVVEIGTEPGPIVEVALEAGGIRLVARITRLSADLLRLAPGTPVWALIKSVALDRHTLSPSPGGSQAELEL